MKQRKKEKNSSILPSLAVTSIDSDKQRKPIAEKKEKRSVANQELEKQKQKEKKKKTKVEEEKCGYCLEILSMGINGTRFSFPCGHILHMECYEILRISFKGSMCPICFSEERFSGVFSNHPEADTEDIKFDIDHAFGMIYLQIYYDQRKKGQVMQKLHQQIPFSTMSEISAEEIAVFRNHDPTDTGEILKKANISLKNVINLEKKQDIIRLFQKRSDVRKIQKLGYNYNDILMSGIRMDFLINNGYTLKDIYDMGFRTYKDLMELQFHHHILTIFNDKKQAIVPVQFLVDWYYIDYRRLIEMFAMFYANSVKIEEKMYEMAVADFCKLKLSKDELLKLGLTNINLFFTSFGKNCFNADCLVNFCQGDEVNNAKILMEVFKFYGKTMEKIQGFALRHFNLLGWEESHPLRKMVNITTPKEVIMKQTRKDIESDYSEEMSSNENVYETNSSEDEEDYDNSSDDSSEDEQPRQPELIDLKKEGLMFSDRSSRPLAAPLSAGMSFSQKPMGMQTNLIGGSSSFSDLSHSGSNSQLGFKNPASNLQNSKRKVFT